MPPQRIVARLSAMLTLLAAAAICAQGTPAPGERVTRSVGETIYAEGAMETVKGIVLAEPDDIMGRRFSAGFYPQVREDDRYTYHSFARDPGAAGIGYISRLKDARTLRAAKDRMQLCVSLPATALGVKVCDSEHSYRRTEIPAPISDGRRLELTFDGKVGNVVRIGYHERTGAGAAATEKNGTLEFDLGVSQIVSYRTVRLEVLSANGNRLDYRLIAQP